MLYLEDEIVKKLDQGYIDVTKGCGSYNIFFPATTVGELVQHKDMIDIVQVIDAEMRERLGLDGRIF